MIYLVIGLAGAGAFNTPPNSTILAVISTRRPSIIALISVYLFPLGVSARICNWFLLKLTLLHSRVDHFYSGVYDRYPIQLAPGEYLLEALGHILVFNPALDHRHPIPDKCVYPFLVQIITDIGVTQGWLTIIMNWTSLLFSSGANLVVPFVLYLLSKRYRASAVLDSHHGRCSPISMSKSNYTSSL